MNVLQRHEMGSEKRQVYDPGTEMVHYTHFLYLNVNDS